MAAPGCAPRTEWKCLWSKAPAQDSAKSLAVAVGRVADPGQARVDTDTEEVTFYIPTDQIVNLRD